MRGAPFSSPPLTLPSLSLSLCGGSARGSVAPFHPWAPPLGAVPRGGVQEGLRCLCPRHMEPPTRLGARPRAAAGHHTQVHHPSVWHTTRRGRKGQGALQGRESKACTPDALSLCVCLSLCVSLCLCLRSLRCVVTCASSLVSLWVVLLTGPTPALLLRAALAFAITYAQVPHTSIA